MADGWARPSRLTRHMALTVPFLGTPTIIDGSEAVVSVETRISEGCCAYPMTPSTTMATAAIIQTLSGVLAHSFGKRGGAVVEPNLALIRDAWGSLLDVTAAVAASSQAATAADPLTDEDDRLRGEVPGTSASPRSLVEAVRLTRPRPS